MSLDSATRKRTGRGSGSGGGSLGTGDGGGGSGGGGGGGSGGGGGGGSGGLAKRVPPLAQRAERAVSRVLWDPQFEDHRDEILVAWTREEKVEVRASGAAAWSQRMRRTPVETPLTQFAKAKGAYVDATPPYHLMTELRLRGRILWSSSWHTDRVALISPQMLREGETAAGIGSVSTDDTTTDDESSVDAVGVRGDASTRIAEDMPRLWMMVLTAVGEVRTSTPLRAPA